MLDESICHFRVVSFILFWMENVDPDQTPQYVAYDLGLHCLPMTLLRMGSYQFMHKYCISAYAFT